MAHVSRLILIIFLAVTAPAAFAQNAVGQDPSNETDDGNVDDNTPTGPSDESTGSGVAQAQDNANESEGPSEANGNYGGSGGSFSDTTLSGFRVTAEGTRAIVKWLEEANVYCGRVPRAYRIDCLADQYKQIERALPKTGDYNRLRKILRKSQTDLRKIVSQYSDPSASKAKPDLPAAQLSASRPLVRVRKSRLQRAEKAAAKVIAETETILLRSAGQSKRRKLAFTRVAKAIGSNKVLLRSA